MPIPSSDVAGARPAPASTAAHAPAAPAVDLVLAPAVALRWLRALVFTGGVSSLALEMCAPRLLGPFVGTDLFVWANIIGFFLVYLAVGYFLGGRVADRHPSARVLCGLTAVAALATGLIPFVSEPILQLCTRGLNDRNGSVFYSSMVAVILLFAVPVTLLGFVSPFAVRLTVRHLGDAGRGAGNLYALSTAGSILGAFLPVLLLIPALGVRRTLLAVAVALLAVSLWGLDVPLALPQGVRRSVRARWLAAAPSAVLLVPLLLPHVAPLGPLKQSAGLIYERESLYNYIQVVRQPDGTNELVLNEGQAIHSVYNPDRILTGWYWDYFLTAPYFNPAPAGQQPQVKRVAIVGLAAGTIARQFTAAYPGVQIDGAEIDPDIVDAGRRYFGMTEPNLHVYEGDGRTFMRASRARYDVVAIDAFQQPYIPFQLTTKEFFADIRAHMTPDGVLCLNTAHEGSDYRLVRAFVNTLSQVFPSVYTFDVPGTFNTEVMATLRPTTPETYARQLAQAPPNSLAAQVGSETVPVVRVAHAERGGVVFTDDKAPIEQLTDQLILNYLQQGG
jgi:spermidine synthase